MPKKAKWINVVCNTCGSNIAMTENKYNKKVEEGNMNFYCNRECYLQTHKAEKIPCVVCGTLHNKRKDTQSKYCSRECYLLEHRIENKVRTCPWCEQEFEAKQSEDIYCSHSCYTSHREYPVKENHPMWKGGFKQNRGYDSVVWRRDVLERDGNRCRCCKATENLHAHHIWAWALHPDMRFELNNGLTLCVDCHKEVHKLYGYEYDGEMLPRNY